MHITCRGKNNNSKHPIILFICMMMNYLNVFVLCQTNVFYLVRLCGLLIFKFMLMRTTWVNPCQTGQTRQTKPTDIKISHQPVKPRPSQTNLCSRGLGPKPSQTRNNQPVNRATNDDEHSLDHISSANAHGWIDR